MATQTGQGPGDEAQRVRSRGVVFLVMAVIIAGLTAYAAYVAVAPVNAGPAGARTDDGALRVVVAQVDLRPGHTIVPEDVTMGPLPEGVGLDRAFSAVDRVVGQTVGERMLPGEVVRSERLLSGGADLRVDEVLDPGTRAVTLRTSHASAVGGLLRPGFYVDVIVTIRPETKDLAAEWVTKTILQGVRVVAVNDVVSSSPGLIEDHPEGVPKPRDIYVTLEVMPAEAEQLALAYSRGQLHLSLRARDDLEMLADDGPLVTNALVGLPPPVAKAQARRLEQKRRVAKPRPEAKEQTTEVIRGGKVTIETFDEAGEHQGTRRPR